jgi:spore maturation protein CgeB
MRGGEIMQKVVRLQLQRPLLKKARWKAKQSGEKLGLDEGYHFGLCETIMRSVPTLLSGHWDSKVLFVGDAYFVYEAIITGLTESMAKLVREITVVPNSDIYTQKINLVTLVEQIKPDLVLVLNGNVGNSIDQIDTIRSFGIKTAAWFVEDPYSIDATVNVVSHFDFAFTHELSCISLYRERGCSQVHYLPLANTSSLYRPKPPTSGYRTDICFVGAGFLNRVSIFDQIAPYLKNKKVVICGKGWNRLNNYRMLKDKIHLHNIPHSETVKYYSGAKIVINIHRNFDDTELNMNSRGYPAYSVNPRTFEISACGTLQLTDIRLDLGNFYTPGYDIETFTSANDLADKIKYYLHHETQRHNIALRALHKTMHAHSYHDRMAKLLTIVFGDGQ